VTDLCVQYNVGSSLKMNQAGVDTLVPRKITGLDGRPIRRTVLAKGATDGGIVQLARYGPRLINVSGIFLIQDSDGTVITPADDLTAYLTRVNTLAAAWEAGLEALHNTNFTLNFTPTGQGAVNKTVRYGYEGAEWQTDWPDVTQPVTFVYGLICYSG
jgi:hypothetical protein